MCVIVKANNYTQISILNIKKNYYFLVSSKCGDDEKLNYNKETKQIIKNKSSDVCSMLYEEICSQ